MLEYIDEWGSFYDEPCRGPLVLERLGTSIASNVILSDTRARINRSDAHDFFLPLLEEEVIAHGLSAPRSKIISSPQRKLSDVRPSV